MNSIQTLAKVNLYDAGFGKDVVKLTVLLWVGLVLSANGLFAKPVVWSESLAEQALQDVKMLAADNMQGRKPGTQGHKAAQQYIVERFQSLELKPWGPKFRQRFEYRVGFKNKIGANLVAWRQGARFPHRYLVVTAHYDHLGGTGTRIYHGADDNASGVAALLLLAGHFSRHAPEHSIIFLATDAEEDGLRGAKAFLQQFHEPEAHIALNINLDMLGQGGRRHTLFVAGTRDEPKLRVLIDFVATSVRTSEFRLKRGHDRRGRGRMFEGNQRVDWRQASDHGPFIKLGIPYLYFGVDTHRHYHQTSDTYDNLDQPFFRQAVHAVWRSALAIDASLE